MPKSKTPQNKIRKCPKCGIDLLAVKFLNEDLDRCPRCMGFWFDAHELDRIKTQIDDDIRWMDINLWQFADRANFRASQFDCPSCETLMSELEFDKSMVTIEFCINCYGVWLDKGELNSIIGYVQTKVALQSIDDYKRTVIQQFKEIFGGHKGVLEEVKDFLAALRMVSIKFDITHPELAKKIQLVKRSFPF